MAKKKISVVIPAYNAEKYLPETIDSLRSQTASQRYWDVTFVDDGSTDRTRGILEDGLRGLPNARYLVNGENRGQPYTRDRAIAASDGEYIALLDADDRFVPETIESSLDFLTSNPSVHYTYSSMRVIDDEGIVTSSKESLPFSRDDLFHYNFVGPVKIFSRELNDAINGYDARVPFAQDWDHVLRASLVLPGGGIKNNPDFLYEYRVHSAGVSATCFEERKRMICDFLGRAVKQKAGRPVEVFWKEKVTRPGNNEYNYFDWRGIEDGSSK